jgi:hypothetical protein
MLIERFERRFRNRVGRNLDVIGECRSAKGNSGADGRRHLQRA